MENGVEHHGEFFQIGKHGMLTGTVFNVEGVTLGYHPELCGLPPETLRNRCNRPCQKCN